MVIIGLILSFIAIGILYYLNNELKKKLKNNNRALLALQKEFTQYQVDEKRVKEKDIAKMEIRHDNIAKSITKNEQLISVRETFDAYNLISALHSFYSIKDKNYKNILPPLTLLSEQKLRELIEKLHKLKFISEKNIAA